MLKQVVFSTQQFKETATRFVLCFIRFDDNPRVAAAFGVHAYPSIQFFSPDGTKIKEFAGASSADAFVQEMDNARAAGN
jgi:thioredoxin-like negative regulator of GroEL